ncbi:MAG: cytochrome-c peroxidase [Saprospiraceae bacterium]|nr:cytochrome-c peroxidase [Saprospiraceae bacterium]
MRTLFLLIATTIAFSSCDKSHSINEEQHSILSEKLNLPADVFDYTPGFSQALINDFPEIRDALERDEVHDHLATMGRVLFYDKRLSRTNEISCASCHLQERAFSDDKAVSRGVNDLTGTRNALALATTMGFETSYGSNFSLPVSGVSAFFSWDDSVFDLTEQSLRAIESDVEMNMDLQAVVNKLESDPIYGVLNKNAFGTSQIMEHNILEALKSFMNSMSSVESKFDKGLVMTRNNPQADFPNFSNSENFGKSLFNRDCSSCHGDSHSFSVTPTANNGLDIYSIDPGKGGVTSREQDMGVFKVPFLRNIEVTSPYMHDGRFNTLEDVIDHYSNGIQPHPNLDIRLLENDGQPKRFDYSSEEKIALIDYLKSLTDQNILTAEKFSDPFK